MDSFDIEFDYESNIPLYIQLYNYMLKLIHDGKLKENEKLPSRRALCSQLKINKNTVESAYQKLTAKGYIISEPRSGFYVRNTAGYENKKIGEVFPDYIYNFSINSIDVLKIPYETWVRLYKDNIYKNPNLFNHGENFGERILQKAIERYLYKYKEITCFYNQIIIGAGIEYLIFMLSIIMDKNLVYGIENPCLERIYSAVNLCDRKICLLDVKKNGFPIEELKKSNINILFVMPSHQYPVGYNMNTQQKKELIEWANAKKNRYIVEVHYDSEFVCENNTSSIQTISKNEKVIYIGDFARTIGPSIKTAFIILPKHLLNKWKERLSNYYAPVNLFEQWVLADFIQEGYFLKHIRQMKTIYSKKREYLISELKKSLFWDKIEMYENTDGLFFIAKFNTDVPEEQMEMAARKEGVKIVPLSKYFFRKSGLYFEKYFVFGFGGLEKFEIHEAVNLLQKAWGTL